MQARKSKTPLFTQAIHKLNNTTMLALLLATSTTQSVCQSAANTHTTVFEGQVVSREELMKTIPRDQDHITSRKVAQILEDTISCSQSKVLAIHYRAVPPTKSGLNDDRIAIAVSVRDGYRVLKVFDSDAGVVDGDLYSNNDFDQKFISIDGNRFLYLQNRISGSAGATDHDVYAISNLDMFSSIPFADVSKTTILKSGEELRNGQMKLEENVFQYAAGIYKPQDPECCASGGTYHAQFNLRGTCKQDPSTHRFVPDFQFLVAKEWRSAE